MSTDNQEIQRLIEALNAPSIDAKHKEVNGLQEYGPGAIGPLIHALAESVENDLRWYCAVAISKIGAPAIAPLLSAMKTNPDRDFRRYAAAALGSMGVAGLPEMIRKIDDER